jgi:cell division protein FtsI/penicillin-binding protein 2
VENFDPKSISAIVSDVATGEILALANYPTYDPNSYWLFPIEAMKNSAVGAIYEPGVIVKIVSLSSALEYGVASEDTTFDCAEQSLMVGGEEIPLPQERSALGTLTLAEAVRSSSTRAAVRAAILLGEQRFYNCLRSYGFGEKVGYGFDGESAGLLSPIQKWDALAITRLPIGWAVCATPLQVHAAMSTIANDGVLLKPNLFKCVLDGGTTILTVESVAKRRVISHGTAIVMRRMMHDPPNGKLANGVEFCYAGGTGRKIVAGKCVPEARTFSMSGFFPVNVPKILLTLVVDEASVDKLRSFGEVFADDSALILPQFKNMALKVSQYIDSTGFW